jgi:hypothetical protein
MGTEVRGVGTDRFQWGGVVKIPFTGKPIIALAPSANDSAFLPGRGGASVTDYRGLAPTLMAVHLSGRSECAIQWSRDISVRRREPVAGIGVSAELFGIIPKDNGGNQFTYEVVLPYQIETEMCRAATPDFDSVVMNGGCGAQSCPKVRY